MGGLYKLTPIDAYGFMKRAAGSRGNDAKALVPHRRLAGEVCRWKWDNDSDENVIESVTLTFDFFQMH